VGDDFGIYVGMALKRSIQDKVANVIASRFPRNLLLGNYAQREMTSVFTLGMHKKEEEKG